MKITRNRLQSSEWFYIAILVVSGLLRVPMTKHKRDVEDWDYESVGYVLTEPNTLRTIL